MIDPLPGDADLLPASGFVSLGKVAAHGCPQDVQAAAETMALDLVQASRSDRRREVVTGQLHAVEAHPGALVGERFEGHPAAFLQEVAVRVSGTANAHGALLSRIGIRKHHSPAAAGNPLLSKSPAPQPTMNTALRLVEE